VYFIDPVLLIELANHARCLKGSASKLRYLAERDPTDPALIKLRGATLVLPTAIDKTNSPTHRPLPKKAVNAPMQHRNPHSV